MVTVEALETRVLSIEQQSLATLTEIREVLASINNKIGDLGARTSRLEQKYGIQVQDNQEIKSNLKFDEPVNKTTSSNLNCDESVQIDVSKIGTNGRALEPQLAASEDSPSLHDSSTIPSPLSAATFVNQGPVRNKQVKQILDLDGMMNIFAGVDEQKEECNRYALADFYRELVNSKTLLNVDGKQYKVFKNGRKINLLLGIEDYRNKVEMNTAQSVFDIMFDRGGKNARYAIMVVLAKALKLFVKMTKGNCRRNCNLVLNYTKPIFLFDGGTPRLKRRAVIARRKQRKNAQKSIVVGLFEHRAKEVGVATVECVATVELRSAALHLSQYIETSTSNQNTKTLLQIFYLMMIIVTAAAKAVYGHNKNVELSVISISNITRILMEDVGLCARGYEDMKNITNVTEKMLRVCIIKQTCVLRVHGVEQTYKVLMFRVDEETHVVLWVMDSKSAAIEWQANKVTDFTFVLGFEPDHEARDIMTLEKPPFANSGSSTDYKTRGNEVWFAAATLGESDHQPTVENWNSIGSAKLTVKATRKEERLMFVNAIFYKGDWADHMFNRSKDTRLLQILKDTDARWDELFDCNEGVSIKYVTGLLVVKICDWPIGYMDINLQTIAKIDYVWNNDGIIHSEQKYVARGMPTEAAEKVLVKECHNGHTLCATCKSRVHNRCPTCRQELGDIRCLALEKVAESLEFHCKYSSLGCPEIFSYYSKLKQEALCNFRPYNCPILYAGSECSVVGDIPILVSHLRNDHKDEEILENVRFIFRILRTKFIEERSNDRVQAKFDHIRPVQTRS